MEWWQILLILLGTIMIGVSVGVLIYYLLSRFVLKRESRSATTFLSHIMEPLIKRHAAAPAVEKPPEYPTPNLARDVPAKREATPVVEEPSQPSAPDLFSEIESNLGLATGLWTGKLLPFQTTMWDTRRDEVDELSPDVREAVQQAYTDIQLANNIVQLSTEFYYRTDTLDENYQKLCATITERISEIKLLMEQSLARDVPAEREVTPAPEKPPPYRTSDLDEDAPAKREAAPVVEEPSQPSTPDLFSEIESNLGLATELWTGKLLPFQTTMWDTRRDEVDKLSPNVREAVGQAYIDIQLANTIVRLSTEHNHRTDTLDERYQKLCATITERINRIKLLMEQSRK